jgi:hypothetical protein
MSPVRRRVALLLVTLLSTPALAGPLLDPLFTPENRWVMRLEGDQPVDLEASLSLREVAGAQVATMTFTPPEGASGWLPSPLCLVRTAKGLFFPEGCTDKQVKHALKQKVAIAEPAVAYHREPRVKAEGDVPLTEAVTLGHREVLGKDVPLVSYAFSQDTGFKAELAPGIGFVTLSWDLQDGGGTLRLQRRSTDTATPPTVSTAEELGLDAKGLAHLTKAGGALQVKGDLSGQGVVTVLLHAEGKHTELLVIDATGKVLFRKKYTLHRPKGLRFEEATGGVAVFFDLGKKLEQTSRMLQTDGKTYALDKPSPEGE